MELWQIIILSLYAIYSIWDGLNPGIGLGNTVLAGAFTGWLLGDWQTGLMIGATLQLMALGIGSYGGASVPDYFTGAVVGTAFAVSSGQSMDVGIAISVPVALLMVQMDVLGRFCNTFFQHMAENGAEERNYKKVEWGNLLGILPWGLSRAIPIFLVLLLGQGIVEQLLSIAPEWLMNGLSVAGGMLPAVGIAILLKYMPIKKFWMYTLLGFVLASYLGLPVLAVALIGLVVAAVTFIQKKEQPALVAANTVENGGTIEDDE
jgi:PTS system mannose-specific IIC component